MPLRMVKEQERRRDIARQGRANGGGRLWTEAGLRRDRGGEGTGETEDSRGGTNE